MIKIDLAHSSEMIQHEIRLQQIARRVQDPAVHYLVKRIVKARVKIGVPQEGPFSPLAASIYLTEVDWTYAIRPALILA
jgi:hypothetical protein